jgi:hypothetical protein
VKKVLLVIVAALIGLVAFQITRSHLEDRQHYVTVDAIQVTGHMPDSYRATVHSSDTVYEITCTDHADGQDGSVKPCRVLEANEVIKFGTLGDLLVFFDNGNFNSWKIESEWRSRVGSKAGR